MPWVASCIARKREAQRPSAPDPCRNTTAGTADEPDGMSSEPASVTSPLVQVRLRSATVDRDRAARAKAKPPSLDPSEKVPLRESPRSLPWNRRVVRSPRSTSVTSGPWTSTSPHGMPLTRRRSESNVAEYLPVAESRCTCIETGRVSPARVHWPFQSPVRRVWAVAVREPRTRMRRAIGKRIGRYCTRGTSEKLAPARAHPNAKAADLSAAFVRDGNITQSTHNAPSVYARRRGRVKPACGWWESTQSRNTQRHWHRQR